MARVHYVADARSDLKDIHGYTVEEWGSDQAARYLRGLRRRCEMLSRHPRMAPATAPGSPLRVALYREHRILYEPVTGGIEVLRIVHQARDFGAVLERIAAIGEILRQRGKRRQRSPR
jgi:plasmid stabilization system protein ParE